jgi:hypothetical protein
MEATQQSQPDDHSARLADTQRLLEEMERLELRARLLLAEHRHVVDTIRDMQRKLDAAAELGPRL